MAKAVRGQIQNYTVTLNGFQGSWQVDADSEDAAVELVKANNPNIAKRDSRNFTARVSTLRETVPQVPPLNPTNKPST